MVARNSNRVSLATVFAFAAVGVPLQALTSLTGIYLPRFYVGLGLGFIAVSGVMALIRVIDAVFDPLVSLVMDRTNTPLGRYRPWIIIGVPITMVATWELLTAKEGVTAGYLTLWLLVVFAGLSIVSLGQAAWGAVLATSYNERSRIFGWAAGIAVLGPVALYLMPALSDGRIVPGQAGSMPALAWLLLISIPVALLITVVFTPEKDAPTAAKPRFSPRDYWAAISNPAMLRLIAADLLLSTGPAAIGPILVYFFHDVKSFRVKDVSLLLAFNVAARLVGSPFWARVARRFNKHRTVQIACVCYGVAQMSLMALPKAQFDVTAFGMAAVGFCASAFFPLVRAMVADVTDEVRLRQGHDLTSLLFSMVTTTAKIGASMSVLVVFPVLAMVGYNGREGAVNTPGAIFGLEMCYLFTPTALVLLGGSFFFGYKLDERRHALVRAELERRDAAMAAALDDAAKLEISVDAPEGRFGR